MLTRTALFVAALATALSPAGASAQSRWTRTATVFGGGSVVPTFGATVVDPAIGAKLEVGNRKIRSAPVGGGAFGAWRALGTSPARLGIRADVSYQPAQSEAQVNAASGTLFGQPFSGPLPVARVDGSATVATGALLFGWETGRLMPFAGGGGGAAHTRTTQLSQTDTNTVASWSAIAGMSVRLSRRVAAHVEYRYTVAEPSAAFGTQTVVYQIKPSQFVSGVSLNF